MGRKKNDRIGERFVNNQGCSFFIVEYIDNQNVTIEFEDEYKTKIKCEYQQCTRGCIKNPYYKSVYGVGYLGANNITEHYKREYQTWENMIKRCYSQHEKYSSYKGVTVCERWHCFANFLEDLPKIENYKYWLEHPNERVHLDKDTLQPNVPSHEKVYAPHTVMFLSNSDNVIESNMRVDKQKNTRIKVKGTNIKTKEVVEFESIKKASETLNINGGSISNNLNGKSKTAGGYHWQYVDDTDEQ